MSNGSVHYFPNNGSNTSFVQNFGVYFSLTIKSAEQLQYNYTHYTFSH